MSGHERAAAFIAGIRWDALPEAVQRKARLCLADSLGATLAGTLTRISRICAGYAADTWPGDEATILLHGQRANAAGAAFANACAANALDSDDSARYAYGHAGAQVFPTALAVAESLGLSGAEMLCGMVVGYEVAHRVGRCWHDHHAEYQACGSWGSVACAAVAAHLMRLSPEQAGQALGIAEYHAPSLPMMRDVDRPAMVKHGVEWAAMTGIVAAGLAAQGFTGIPSILAFEPYQAWVEDIGEQYLMVDGVAWKAVHYACCGWAHAGVEGARRLVQEHGLALDEIAHIRVEGGHGTYRLGTRLPATTEEAQFNQAWPVAAMLLDGEVGPAQMLEERLGDPRLRELAAKVEVVETEEMQELCRLFEQGDPRGRFAGAVTITMRDGRQYHSGMVDAGLRFPPVGWDEARMEAKFRWLAGQVLNESKAAALAGMLWHMQEVPDVGELTQQLQ